MRVSSRTPEGDPQRCPVCGKETRTEPSETPTRDAPCPHCGQLLWFAAASEETATQPERSPKTYEGTLLKLGRERFGAIPGNLVHPLLEGLGTLVHSRCVRSIEDMELLVSAAANWTELALRLRRMAGLPTRFAWAYATRDFMRRQFRRLARRRLRSRHA